MIRVAGAGAFFSYTSNVDAHFFMMCWTPARSGNAMGTWSSTSVAVGGWSSRTRKKEKRFCTCQKMLAERWRAPSNLAPYAVSTDTMLAEGRRRASSLAAKTSNGDTATIGHTGGTVEGSDDHAPAHAASR